MEVGYRLGSTAADLGNTAPHGSNTRDLGSTGLRRWKHRPMPVTTAGSAAARRWKQLHLLIAAMADA